MTEEERQRLFAEMLRKRQAEVGMLSQSTMTPEELAAAMQQSGYDPAGKEAMLATMLRGGQDAVFSDMPQGKQIGDIYVAPTWSESLNAAAQKGIGGWQMGQARKEQTAIDEKRALSKTAEARLAAEAARKEQLATAESGVMDMMTAEQKAAMDAKRLQQQADIAAANRSAADSRLTRTLEAQGRVPPVNPETARHNREMEAIAREKAQNTKKKDSYELGTQKEREKFAQGGEKLRATMDLASSFNDDYAAPAALRAVGLGKVENTLQGSVGVGTEGQADYWSKVAKTELVPRHEMFGSAFTKPEQEAYNATTITPDLRPEEIRARLARRVELETLATERMAAGALMKGMSPDEVTLYYGDVIDIPALQESLANGEYEQKQTARRKAAADAVTNADRADEDLNSLSLEELRRRAAGG